MRYNIGLSRSVAQSGSAPGLGPGGPRFESLYSDHFLFSQFPSIRFLNARQSIQ